MKEDQNWGSQQIRAKLSNAIRPSNLSWKAFNVAFFKGRVCPELTTAKNCFIRRKVGWATPRTEIGYASYTKGTVPQDVIGIKWNKQRGINLKGASSETGDPSILFRIVWANRGVPICHNNSKGKLFSQKRPFRRTNHIILALYMMSVVMAKKLKVTTMLVYNQDGGRGTMLLSQLQWTINNCNGALYKVMAHLNLGKSHATVSLHISNGGRFNPNQANF
jgi:hypothetical protein